MNSKSPLHRRIDPARLLFDLNVSAKVWFVLFLVMMLALVLSLFASLRPRAGQIEGAFVIGTDGIPYWARRVDWNALTNHHVRMAQQATTAFLMRNPAGFDVPEEIELHFLPEAAARAKASCEQEAPERQARELHQKPEVQNVQFLRLVDDRVRVSLRGQLIQAGNFRGQTIVEAVPFQFDLELVPNPNFAVNGQIPSVVHSFHYEALPR